ncbi:hypothetical protein [Streptomyces odonnellii]|uniref:hypothetical protein n=1 Tax=Streptomyces odonnellii TaxID=1417980 RepID=UPI0006253387|nr:hypothetical protein [Streptomyces odonnellii]
MDTSLAVGILDDVNGMGTDIKTILGSTVLIIMYLALVAGAGFTTRSILKTGVAAIGGAIVLGIVAAQTVLSSKTAEELRTDHSAARPAGVVRIVDTLPSLSSTGGLR